VVSGGNRFVLRLAECRAVLAGDVPTALASAPGVDCVEMRPARRAVSPGASYAVDAVKALATPTRATLAAAAMFTFAGPPGSALPLFDPARDPIDGRLVTPGFGLDRSRRLHPFLLLLALQNQVAATLSLELALRGPCCSTTDSAAAFAELVPNMAMAARTRPVLAVLASAANRSEQKTRGIYETGGDGVIEGAVALLFTEDGELGMVTTGDGADPPIPAPAADAGKASDASPGSGWAPPEGPPTRALFAPVLEPGLSILLALARGLDRARLEIREPQRTTAFRWSRL
jgi:hypothetical protein